MKIVINRCFGGFGLSDKACERMIELGYEGLTKSERSIGGSYYGHYIIERNNPLLVQVVEELGKEADGFCAELGIVTIPDDVDWYIHEYDGLEHVAENHRTWYGEDDEDD
jgi:hypothetical protein